MESSGAVIIKFNQANDQSLSGIRKVSGFVKLKNFIEIIDVIDLDANPRHSKIGKVTRDIQESIRTTPELLPFKTKGVLLAASEYEALDRSRFRVRFAEAGTEGILDGGHNTLAIGMYILSLALESAGSRVPRGISTWNDFKEAWRENRGAVNEYLQRIRSEQKDTQIFDGELDAFVPVELLLPVDPEEYESEVSFRKYLLEICVARNNNVQLSTGTKANQQGYFDSLRSLFEKTNKDLADRIEWKSNEGGVVKVEDVISLAWIPLALLAPFEDDRKRRVEAPAPTTLYSGKQNCLSSFERMMSSEAVTSSSNGDYKRELHSTSVLSAFKIAVQLPELYDYIFEKLPELYNEAGGKYGRITAVKKLNERKKKETHYLGKEIQTLSPDGFVAPLVYGLQALMEVKEEDGKEVVVWKEEPMSWLEKNLPAIVKSYSDVFEPWGYDPQKVGKSSKSYTDAINAYKMALAGIL